MTKNHNVNQAEETKRLLATSKERLEKVNESYLLKSARRREYPTFAHSEVQQGPVLGVGGFGIVYQVQSFLLHAGESNDDDKEGIDGVIDQERSDQVNTTVLTSSTAPGPDISDNNDGEDENDDKLKPFQGNHSVFGEGAKDDTNNHNKPPAPSSSSRPPPDEVHYNIRIAREQMFKYARRNGQARYAIKRLQQQDDGDLNELERARGALDLALEAKFLSVIWHPNIVKMRGLSIGSSLDPGFFIIMDRLYGTLADMMDAWEDRKSQSKGKMFGIGADKASLRQLMLERMTVAYDLAAAFGYLHEKRLVYRDIKQENIGFDIRGDVKVFDFGLSKALSKELKTRDKYGRELYGYNLTARTGSVPYMAPEIVNGGPYDCQCDVFSFSILLWEILALREAFKGYSKREFSERVARSKERLPIKRNWPPLTKMLIREAWEHDPEKRPTMARVASMLRGDLNDMTDDSTILDRSAHMRRRSEHSMRHSRRMSRSQKSMHGGDLLC